jgi:two-component system, NarL family, sensor histidine kinase EvgS
MLATPRVPCFDAIRWKRCAVALFVLFSAAFAHAKTIPLTAEEQLWIAEHPVIAYGFEAEGTPYAFEEDGRHQGLDADLLELIGRKTGLRFAAETGIGLEAAIERVRAGTLPMVSFVTPSPKLAGYMLFTDATVTIQYAIFTGPRSPLVESAPDLAGKYVAMRPGFHIEPLAGASNDIVIVPYSNVAAALRAAAVGEVDAAVAPIATGAYVERAMGVSRVMLQAVLPETYPLSFGVGREQKILLAILDKGLSSVSPDEMRKLKTRWFVGEPTFTRSEILATAATTAAAVLLLAGLIVSWLYRRLRL